MKVGRMAQSSSEQAAATSPAGTSKGGCPIILVHGFGGWSRDTMKGLFWYWGGMNDLASDLQKNCPYNKILTASVGPFSSVSEPRLFLMTFQPSQRQDLYSQRCAVNVLKLDGNSLSLPDFLCVEGVGSRRRALLPDQRWNS